MALHKDFPNNAHKRLGVSEFRSVGTGLFRSETTIPHTLSFHSYHALDLACDFAKENLAY
jgi:hypothetical protein